jgi:hypothetical protein
MGILGAVVTLLAWQQITETTIKLPEMLTASS